MADKTTYIVGLHKSQIEQLSAFQHLPDSWTDAEGNTYTVVEANDCKLNVINGEHSCVFDLYISFLGDAVVPTRRDSYAGIEFFRVSKDHQAAFVNRVAKLAQFTDFHPMRSWSEPRHVLTDKRYLVLKPSLGARGVGQLFVDTHAISLWKVHETIHFMKQKTEGVFDFMRERLVTPKDGKPAAPCSFSTEGDRPTKSGTAVPEGVSLLMGDFIIEEMVENVALEFRVLTDEHGHPWHISERTTAPLGNSFGDDLIPRKVVTGGNGPQDWIHINGKITEDQIDKMANRSLAIALFMDRATEYVNLLNYAMRGISALQLPLHSVDLFITSDRKWGIFEFSCEFGKGTVDPRHLTECAKKFIAYHCHQR
ncbi:MAG: hypothetical protein PHN51_10265 [Candidatus Nanopelagicales bacterium]|nr:hypothetical protein [Candidatus Nanopelagicales bacterium]